MIQAWKNYWFSPQSAFNLGVCRFLAYFVVMIAYLQTPFSHWAELGPKSPFWEPLWLFKTLHLPVLGASALGLVQLVWKISLVMACVGLFTTYSTVITWLLGTYLIALTFNYGKIEHQTMPMIIVLGILALSRCGDGFSLDAWLAARRGRPAPPPSGEYRWPIRMVWLLMSITFFAAGIAKLRGTGIHWATGPAFSTLLIQQFYSVNPPHVRWGLFIANHRMLSHLMAGGSLLTELLFPLAMFHPKARRIFPLATFGMQVGIGLMMNVWFIQFLALYVFWVPWDALLRRESVGKPAGCDS